ncbi:hypothetical protein PR048_011293 [Dryococelus australis]|uniref:Reverse transcriptase/retrotransposon-derived protein RNase H-like domain-containing protein n=1 Tax=Dryococelus australis TaxID=614101 RepID=A0ABQ9HLI6_9NEOP|nr:hypothetical protein PR048_011293 [Dryococelus australis]
MSCAYTINLKEGCMPYDIAALRRVALPLRKKVKQELDKMVQEDVVAPINSPTEWCAPVGVVLKKDAQKEAVNKLKEEIYKEAVIALYQRNVPTRIAADTMSFGVGAVLEQQQQDHKPLVPLLQTQPLADLMATLRRLRMCLTCFVYSMVHVPVKSFYIPDALSRGPGKDNGDDAEEGLFNQIIIAECLFSDTRIEELRKESRTLPTERLYTGGLSRQNKFWTFRGRLSFYGGLIMYGARIFVPSGLRHGMLQWIHDRSMGITKCCRRAKESVW